MSQPLSSICPSSCRSYPPAYALHDKQGGTKRILRRDFETKENVWTQDQQAGGADGSGADGGGRGGGRGGGGGGKFPPMGLDRSTLRSPPFEEYYLKQVRRAELGYCEGVGVMLQCAAQSGRRRGAQSELQRLRAAPTRTQTNRRVPNNSQSSCKNRASCRPRSSRRS